MKFFNLLILVIVSLVITSSCSSKRKLARKNSSNRSSSGQTYIAEKKDISQPVKKSPSTIRVEALAYWNSGLVHQKQFYQTNNKDYAKIAMKKYEKYYSLQPNGTYAGSSLIRMAELAYSIGDNGRAQFELHRIKNRYDLKSKYSEEIKILEDIINK